MEVDEQTKRVGWWVGMVLSGSATRRLSAEELRKFDESTIDEYSRLRGSGPLPETLPTHGHGSLPQPGFLPPLRFISPQLQHRPRPWRQPQTCFCSDRTWSFCSSETSRYIFKTS